MSRRDARPASGLWAPFTGRLEEALHRGAQDLALALDLGFNDLLVDAIESFVRSQLDAPAIATAVARIREARTVTPAPGGPKSRARGGRSRAATSRSPT